MACILVGTTFLVDMGENADVNALPDWGGFSDIDHFPHEIEKNQVTVKEIRSFEDSLWDEYEDKIHKIQTTRDLVANTNPPL